MPRTWTEGEGQPPAERTARAAWLVLGFAAILIGFPLGFVLVAGDVSAGWFAAMYAGLALVAIAAAIGYASSRRGSRV